VAHLPLTAGTLRRHFLQILVADADAASVAEMHPEHRNPSATAALAAVADSGGYGNNPLEDTPWPAVASKWALVF